MDSWCAYMLLCGDGSYYTGATNRLKHRIRAHAAGRGARYTRSHLPVRLAWCQLCPDKVAALALERRVKRYNRKQKQLLAATWRPE